MREPDLPGTPARARRIPVVRRWSLVADHDVSTARLLGRALPSEGFRVGTVESAAAVLECVAHNRPDAIVLGSDLPDMKAFDLISRLDAGAGPPLLMLLAAASDGDVVRALDAGAGDCMRKPFMVGELAARLRKLVRRRLMNQGFVTGIRTGVLDVDCVLWRVRVCGIEIRLSASEHAVMRMLVEDVGNVVSTNDLLGRVGGSSPSSAWPLRPVVQSLRRKLGLVSGGPVRLLSVQQVGYRLVVPDHRGAGVVS